MRTFCRVIGQSVYDEAQELAKQAWVNNFNRENDKKLGLFGGKNNRVWYLWKKYEPTQV